MQEPQKHQQTIHGVDSNQILVDQKKKTIYLPGYMRLHVKNFVSMDLENLDVQLNVTIIFSIFFGDLPQVVSSALKDQVVLLFEKNEGITLAQVQDGQRKLQNKIKTSKFDIQYSIRKKIRARIQCDLFYTPFQIIHSIISITVQPIKFGIPLNEEQKQKQKQKQQKQKQQKQKQKQKQKQEKNQDKQKWTIKVNLMDYQMNKHLKLSTNNGSAFGNYQLAQNLTNSYFYNQKCQSFEQFGTSYDKKWSNYQLKRQQKQMEIQILKQKPFSTESEEDQINQFTLKQKETDFKNFQYAHFNIPLYKYPYVSIMTIFLPLLILAIINFGIFFQNQKLYDRIATISALMIAFVALLPTIRQQIPPTPSIVLIDGLVYLETFASLLAFIDSLNIRISSITDYQFQWTQNWLFIISVIISVIMLIVIIILMILHGCLWEPSYNQQPYEDEKKQKFDPKKWCNPVCAQQFEPLISQNKKKVQNKQLQLKYLFSEANNKKRRELYGKGDKKKKQQLLEKKEKKN